MNEIDAKRGAIFEFLRTAEVGSRLLRLLRRIRPVFRAQRPGSRSLSHRDRRNSALPNVRRRSPPLLWTFSAPANSSASRPWAGCPLTENSQFPSAIPRCAPFPPIDFTMPSFPTAISPSISSRSSPINYTMSGPREATLLPRIAVVRLIQKLIGFANSPAAQSVPGGVDVAHDPCTTRASHRRRTGNRQYLSDGIATVKISSRPGGTA